MTDRTCSIEGCSSSPVGRGWCKKHWGRWRRNGDPSATHTPTRGIPINARFDGHVDTSGTCWLWTGRISPTTGYASFRVDGVSVSSHRFAYERAYGPIPPGLVVRHSCDQRACMRPDHLLLGTHAENMRDMVVRSRSARGERDATAKLTEGQVLAIRAEYASGGITHVALASAYGVSRSEIGYILRREVWGHI